MKYFIEQNIQIAQDVYSMKINAPDIAIYSKPGQFLNVKVPHDKSKILRRPISICDIEDDFVTIVYQIKGEGTKLFSKLKADDEIDLLGPLGKGFPIVNNKKIALVGGGIGIFPLLFLKKQLSKNNDIDSFIGFRNKECVVFTDEFSKDSTQLCVATDDGSMYNEGLITSYFQEKIKKYDVVYSCGPAPMMKSVKEISEKENVLLYLSLEQRMGCGIGACLVCACKVKTKDGFDYKHVCKDGPVFDSREVIL